MKFSRAVFVLFRQDVIVTGINGLISIILSRWLGPTQLGLFYLINLIPTYSEKFGRLGMLDQAAIYVIKQKEFKFGSVAAHIFFFSLLFAFVPIVLFAFFKNFFFVMFLKSTAVPLLYVWTAVAMIPFMFLFIAGNKLVLSQGDYAFFNRLHYVKAVLVMGLVLFFWFRKWDYFGVILASFISLAVVSLLNLKRVVHIDPLQWSPDRALIKKLWGMGGHLYALSIINFLHQRADLLLVGLILFPQDVAFYSLAVNFAQLLWKVPDAINKVLYPMLSDKKSSEAVAFSLKVCRMTLFILLLGCLGLALTAVPFVKWGLGKRYLPLLPALFLILPGILFMGGTRVLTDLFQGQGRVKPLAATAFPPLLINLTLNLWLIPLIGIKGAAMASSFTYGIQFLLLSYRAKKFWNFPLHDLFFINGDDFRAVLQLVSQKNLAVATSAGAVPLDPL